MTGRHRMSRRCHGRPLHPRDIARSLRPRAKWVGVSSEDFSSIGNSDFFFFDTSFARTLVHSPVSSQLLTTAMSNNSNVPAPSQSSARNAGNQIGQDPFDALRFSQEELFVDDEMLRSLGETINALFSRRPSPPVAQFIHPHCQHAEPSSIQVQSGSLPPPSRFVRRVLSSPPPRGACITSTVEPHNGPASSYSHPASSDNKT